MTGPALRFSGFWAMARNVLMSVWCKCEESSVNNWVVQQHDASKPVNGRVKPGGKSVQQIGILGVGELTEKVVMGLRRSGYTGRICLSPRNQKRAEALRDNWDCEVMDSNQRVADGSAVLFLGVRPEAVEQVAKEVSVTSDQTVISLVAGMNLQELDRHFPHAKRVRAMLSYAAQINQSTVVVTPAGEPHESLLHDLGTLVVLDNEQAFELATVAACMNGWFYFFLGELQQWFVEKGLNNEQAAQLVMGNMQDCLASACQQPGLSLEELGNRIATPGTFTAAGLDVLNGANMREPWRQACDVVLQQLVKTP